MSDTASTAPNWFAQFHDFTYDAPAGVRSNFRRLAEVRGWGGRPRNRRWAECQIAQFGNLYGTDHEKLEAWQALCREVYIKNPPGSIKGCKKVSDERSVKASRCANRRSGSWKSKCPSQSSQLDRSSGDGSWGHPVPGLQRVLEVHEEGSYISAEGGEGGWVH
jgi:hypothetical protein